MYITGTAQFTYKVTVCCMKSFFMDCTTYLCNIICLYIFLRKQNQEFRLNKDCDITVYDIETIVIAL